MVGDSSDDEWETAAERLVISDEDDPNYEEDLTITERNEEQIALKEKGVVLIQKEFDKAAVVLAAKNAAEKAEQHAKVASKLEEKDLTQRLSGNNSDDDWETAAERLVISDEDDPNYEEDLTITERNEEQIALKEKGVVLIQREFDKAAAVLAAKNAAEKAEQDAKVASKLEGKDFKQRLRDWKKEKQLDWSCESCQVSNHHEYERCFICNSNRKFSEKPVRVGGNGSRYKLKQHRVPAVVRSSCKHVWECLDKRVHNKGKGKYQNYKCKECKKYQKRYV